MEFIRNGEGKVIAMILNPGENCSQYCKTIENEFPANTWCRDCK